MDQRTVSSVIAGCPVADAPGGRIRSTNPARLDEVVADVALGDAALLVTAARAARDAQQAWADVPAPVRGRAIAHIGRLVEDNKQALAALVTREIGKPYPEALGEVQEIIDTCDFFLGEGRRLYGQTVPSEMPDKQLFTFRNPVGAVAVITAGNFPVAVPSWYIVPALLCGNTVVWKPAEYSAAVAAAFHELFCRGGGLPPGVFNVVYADGPTTFAGLEQALDAGLIDKVGFTGSSEVGARIGELAGRHLQSACLELGGKNPMVVTANADVSLAQEALKLGACDDVTTPCDFDDPEIAVRTALLAVDEPETRRDGQRFLDTVLDAVGQMSDRSRMSMRAPAPERAEARSPGGHRAGRPAAVRHPGRRSCPRAHVEVGLRPPDAVDDLERAPPPRLRSGAPSCHDAGPAAARGGLR